MPNGKPGDHPLTDILVHKLKVYGREADDLIRKDCRAVQPPRIGRMVGARDRLVE
jgi:hypothetical protein